MRARDLVALATLSFATACPEPPEVPEPDAGTFNPPPPPACNHEGESDEETFLSFRGSEIDACLEAMGAKCALECAADDCATVSPRECAPAECDRRDLEEVRETALAWWCFAGTVHCTDAGGTEADSFCFPPQQN